MESSTYSNHTGIPRNSLESATSLLSTPQSAAGVRRPVTTAVATAGVQRRRVIKKHIQQKYMLCGFAIHVHTMLIHYIVTGHSHSLLIKSLTCFFILKQKKKLFFKYFTSQIKLKSKTKNKNSPNG